MKMKFGNDKHKILYSQTYTQKYPPYILLRYWQKKRKTTKLEKLFYDIKTTKWGNYGN